MRMFQTTEELKQALLDKDFAHSIVFESPSYLSAVVGYDEDGRVIYSYSRMIESLMEEEGCSAEEAMEWIGYNTIRSLPYLGTYAPIILYDFEV